MKAFVTGGTGFIGSHLVDALLKKPNNEIRCLIRSNDKWLHDKDIVKVKGTLQDLAALQRGIENTDTIFHIAGLVKAPDQKTFDRTNVEATENILRLAMKQNVPKLVVLSSLAACGPSFNRPLNEEDPLMPITRYGVSKKKMEEMIARVADDRISVTIVRPPAVYGPREDQIFTVFQMASCRFFPIFGDGAKTRVSLIHVRDLIDGILLASAEKKPGVETYFISSEDTYTWNEISRATEQIFGKKLYGIHIRPLLIESIGFLMEKIASLIGRYPVINRDKAKELGMQWTCSVNKARNRLGFRQKTDLKSGLNDTILWYKRHHWL
ncbi:MAG: NAD(P)-dependent oxidoreductase [Balneolales bacterium]